MVEELKSPYFPVMPSHTQLVSKLEAILGVSVAGVELFPHSSCTPAFRAQLDSPYKGRRQLVIRGEQQNDMLVTEPAERSLEKEMWTLNRVRQLGIGVPALLAEEDVFCVPAYDVNGDKQSDFRFFLMEFAEGVAIDRRIIESSPKERRRLLARVAEIYATVHAVTGSAFGLADSNGRTVSGHRCLEDFLNALLQRKADLADQLISENLGAHVRRFCDREIGVLQELLKKDGYQPVPRLVFYDGFAGNMLIDGDAITMIDMALAGFFEPLTEFCTVIYSLKSILFSENDSDSEWEQFLQAYRSHGGQLPPTHILVRLMHIMCVNLMLHNAIYCRSFQDAGRQSQSHMLAGNALALMNCNPQSVAQLAGHI